MKRSVTYYLEVSNGPSQGKRASFSKESEATRAAKTFLDNGAQLIHLSKDCHDRWEYRKMTRTKRFWH